MIPEGIRRLLKEGPEPQEILSNYLEGLQSENAQLKMELTWIADNVRSIYVPLSGNMDVTLAEGQNIGIEARQNEEIVEPYSYFKGSADKEVSR